MYLLLFLLLQYLTFRANNVGACITRGNDCVEVTKVIDNTTNENLYEDISDVFQPPNQELVHTNYQVCFYEEFIKFNESKLMSYHSFGLSRALDNRCMTR